MNVRFLRAISYILEHHEGGFSDDPEDPGGRTIFGIAEKSFPAAWTSGDPTLTNALQIYWNEFWTRLRCDEFKTKQVSAKLMDMGVNMGVSRAVKILQESVNALRQSEDGYVPLLVDGNLGGKTVAAVNEYRNQRSIVPMMSARQAQFYLDLNKPRFLAGWLWRSGWDGQV